MHMRRFLNAVLLSLVATGAHALEAVSAFGTLPNENPGALDMFQHVPAGASGPLPLVVVLHGCTQTGPAYANGAGWVTLADRFGFALVVAGQRAANNQNSCFNWFESGDIARDSGEARSIRNMVTRFSSAHSVDSARVFVTGLSAGGAMTAVMLATYPDVFAAGGVVAGVPYKCGTTLNDALTCMNTGRSLTPQQWADLARSGAPTFGGQLPRLSIWHGAADTTVRPVNADNLQTQWKAAWGLGAATSSSSAGNHAWQVWNNGSQVVMEDHRITGMNHGTPVDPGSGMEQCGTAGAFLLDVNVCSSLWLARFFGLAANTPAVDGGAAPVDAGSAPPDAGITPAADAGVAPVGGTRETFSAADGTDLDGWMLGAFAPDAFDHTGGNSRSMHARVETGGAGCANMTAETRMMRAFALGAQPSLSFVRRVDLNAAININTTARFRVLVNGTPVDDTTATFETVVEAGWNPRVVPLAAYANQTVQLTFVLEASTTVCIAAHAEAWIDDVELLSAGNPPADAGPAADAGNPTLDAGLAPQDAAFPGDAAAPLDAGSPGSSNGSSGASSASSSAGSASVSASASSSSAASSSSSSGGSSSGGGNASSNATGTDPADDDTTGCACAAPNLSAPAWAWWGIGLWALRARRRR